MTAETGRPTVTVVLPRSLTALFPGTSLRCAATGSTVTELIDDLEQRVPGLRDRLCDGTALRRHLNIFVAGQQAALSTAVHEGELVHVIPAVSGG
ncbi:MAG: MoaD/ThiS family protein [Chloroflexota bacterium]|nr:MoaD/ThiS family protein [Chloroflexota bacterium]